MIKVIKLRNLIYENIKPYYVDENGDQIWNVPNTFRELQQAIQDTIVWLAKQRVQKVMEQYAYNGLADVLLYANQGDAETQQILNWYSNNNATGYDDLIWNWIENTLPTFKTVEDLLNLDLKKVEEDIYQQALNNNPLP